ncbi:uncharacterized protein VNE69_08009 [Vairimorpha necatrix]|uniref:Membrane protein n=1 Tax=Vairimorpha necatrix TaxID=6039 RepID=A0AAX4JEP6_9MICR
MFFFLPVIYTMMSVYNNDSYNLHSPYLDDDTDSYNPIEESFDNILDNKSTDLSPLNVKVPKNVQRSIRYGKIKTNPENLETLIQHEMEDISPDVHNKVRNKLANSNVDRSRYRDVFFIKKRIIQDGNRRIVSFDIKEKIIPKNGVSDPVNKDLSLRVILAGILFLLAGLVFTTTMKMYQNVFKNTLFPYDGHKEQKSEPLK